MQDTKPKYMDKEWLKKQVEDKERTYKDISEEFDVGRAAIGKWARKYNLSYMGRGGRFNQKWTEKEDQIIIDNYSTETAEIIEGKLPGRNWKAIRERARKLGVERPKVEIDKNKLHELYFEKGYSTRDIGERFDCSYTVIQRRLKKWFPEKYNTYSKIANRKYKIEDIVNLVTERNYKFLDVKPQPKAGFVTNKDRIKISCPNKDHEPYWAYIQDFQKGKKCEACSYEIDRSGENSHNYNPNLTERERKQRREYKEYKIWRERVYERDNYTCQVCGDDTGGNLVAHHIKSYRENPGLRTKVDNGVTLCDKCHRKFHNQFGYGDNTKEQWRKFQSMEVEKCENS